MRADSAYMQGMVVCVCHVNLGNDNLQSVFTHDIQVPLLASVLQIIRTFFVCRMDIKQPHVHAEHYSTHFAIICTTGRQYDIPAGQCSLALYQLAWSTRSLGL